MDQPLLGASAPTPNRTPSFKEDTYHLHNLKPSKKKALQDLKTKLTQEHADVTMWGVPLLPSTTSECNFKDKEMYEKEGHEVWWLI